ncbi:helix-turn-helix domain-containing protein [Phenylobacterium sp.]|uniref:winged helix-turn-helix domain-containing protein n=1 Tax=Phenylobacterium sp. TaxID=1871053 RepID=UPI002E33F7C2|nr:helix-turn-helix domain-containing protein [Phenylobacterium sp.]HEX4712732.1 helix-turn-helix domain-containing protein [Phenylobacterium sp.]
MRLTPREYQLLRILAGHAGQVVTHRQIITAVWGTDTHADAQFVRVLMAQLRQKLEANPASPELLLTEPGIGYRLSCED